MTQGVSNDGVQTIVKAKGEGALLSECIDAAMEEEPAILSARKREVSPPPEVVQGMELEDPASHPEKMEDLDPPDVG
jgi:hypothetical protein